MEAKELRLGNYGNRIYPNGRRYFESLSNFEDANDFAAESDPIPITPEILVKAGFVAGSDSLYYKDSKFTVYNRFGNFGLVGGGLSWNEFKYVHQLQNLHFALTGEELTFEL